MPKTFLLAQSKDGKDRQTAPLSPILAFFIIPSTHTLFAVSNAEEGRAGLIVQRASAVLTHQSTA
jgi:hypothetical protein